MMLRRKPILSLSQVLPTWLLLGIFFLAPLWMVFSIGFLPSDEFGDPVAKEVAREMVKTGDWGWMRNYQQAATEKVALITYWRSLWIAGLTTILCLVVGYPVAYYIAIVAKSRWRNLLLMLVAIPFWTSFVVRTSAWKFILGAQGPLDQMSQWWFGVPLDLMATNTAVLIGLVYGNLPFMILPIYASLEKLDRTLLEASQDLGAGPWRTFMRVTVPLTRPGIVAGVVLVFIPSVGQYVVSDLLGGARNWLSGNLIHFQFRDANGSKPLGSAIAFVLMALVLLILIAYAVWARGRDEPPAKEAV